MRLDGRYVAVLDRFEDDLAVLLVEEDGELVEEIAVDRDELPKDARQQDAVVEITLDSGNLRAVDYLPEETEQRTTEAQDRFDRLSQRPPGSDEVSDSGSEVDSDDGTETDSDAGDSDHVPSAEKSVGLSDDGDEPSDTDG